MNVQRKIPSRLHHTAYVTNDLEIAPAKLGATPRGAAGFTVVPTARGAGLLSKRRHQTDFHRRQGLRDRTLHLGCLSNLRECGGVDAGNLAFGFECYAGDRETSRYRAEMDRSFRMDACRCVALLRQRRRQSHRQTRRVSGGDKLLRVRAGAVRETRLYEYLPSKAPLPSLSVPAPSFRSPRHSASEIRFAIVHSIRIGTAWKCVRRYPPRRAR